MTIQKQHLVVKEITNPNDFLKEARRAILGDVFVFPDELTQIESCQPHMHGLLGVLDSSDERYVYITGHRKARPRVPLKTPCFSFKRGFAFIDGRHLMTLLPTNVEGVWKKKVLYSSTQPIADCYECITGDLFVIEKNRRIVQVLGRKSFSRKFAGRMMRSINPEAPIVEHYGNLLPDHAWEEIRIAGQNIWTRSGFSFYKNGKKLYSYPVPKKNDGNGLTPPTIWNNEWKWFVIIHDSVETVAITCVETNIDKETSTRRTTTRFYAAEDGRLLFEEPGQYWRLCQANGQIVLYDPETFELRIANKPDIVTRYPFTKVEPHFVGVTLVRKYFKNGRQVIERSVVPLPAPRQPR